MKHPLFLRSIRPDRLRTVAAVCATMLTAATFSLASTGATTGGPEASLARVKAPSAAEIADGSFTCTADHLAVVEERRERIAKAPTVEEARELALAPARAARRALQIAALVAPSSEKLAEARTRLDGFETKVEHSPTPAAVAGEFEHLLDLQMRSGKLVQLADLEVKGADVRGPGGCHYTTGEIIAIIIGFILFIIPGIILLFLLC